MDENKNMRNEKDGWLTWFGKLVCFGLPCLTLRVSNKWIIRRIREMKKTS